MSEHHANRACCEGCVSEMLKGLFRDMKLLARCVTTKVCQVYKSRSPWYKFVWYASIVALLSAALASRFRAESFWFVSRCTVPLILISCVVVFWLWFVVRRREAVGSLVQALVAVAMLIVSVTTASYTELQTREYRPIIALSPIGADENKAAFVLKNVGKLSSTEGKGLLVVYGSNGGRVNCLNSALFPLDHLDPQNSVATGIAWMRKDYNEKKKTGYTYYFVLIAWNYAGDSRVPAEETGKPRYEFYLHRGSGKNIEFMRESLGWINDPERKQLEPEIEAIRRQLPYLKPLEKWHEQYTTLAEGGRHD